MVPLQRPDSGGRVPPVFHQTETAIGRSEDTPSADRLAALIRREYTVTAQMRFPRGIPPAALRPPWMEVVRQLHLESSRVLHLEQSGRATLVIYEYSSATHIEIAAADHETAGALWDFVRDRAVSLLQSDNWVPCALWAASSGMPRNEPHQVRAVAWPDVRRNYPRKTARSLEWLMSMSGGPPADRGRLILWHGPAGTGKTTAVTSLMSAWLPWCSTSLISDPERFFLEPDYLMTVTRSSDVATMKGKLGRMDQPSAKRWKLVVCEDADEYLRADARQRSGPALGRLLNLTDGLLGRGSDAIVLLTTNDDLTRLHPAVTRPGRCLSLVNFPAMSGSEAAEWCPPGLPAPTNGATLAELFALLSGGQQAGTGPSPETGMYL